MPNRAIQQGGASQPAKPGAPAAAPAAPAAPGAVCATCKGSKKALFVEKGRGLKSSGPCPDCVKV